VNKRPSILAQIAVSKQDACVCPKILHANVFSVCVWNQQEIYGQIKNHSSTIFYIVLLVGAGHFSSTVKYYTQKFYVYKLFRHYNLTMFCISVFSIANATFLTAQNEALLGNWLS